MVDRFNVGASTIRKYVDIVYNVLMDKDNLFNKYISIPSGQHLKDIIACFENLIGIPNICGVIDGTHIPLANFPSKKITVVIGDFLIGKSSIVLCCKPCVMSTKSFGTIVLANLEGYMMVVV
jgi:hypothetical protein